MTTPPKNEVVVEDIRALRRMPLPELAASLGAPRRPGGSIEKLFGRLPPEVTQAQFTGLSSQQTFLQALTFLDLCRATSDELGVDFGGADATVLDFGCGWGRITQLLSLFFSSEKIVACDVMGSALALCQENGVRASYRQMHSWPPSTCRDESIDTIVAYSVFSHLSEDNANAWIREFHRILRPTGTIFITTRHRWFLDYVGDLRRKSKDIPDFARGAAGAFVDHEAYVSKYDRGEYCFDPLGSGGPGLTAVYGEAVIPPAYPQRHWSSMFSKIRYLEPISAGLLDQATIAMRK
jgi:SAM-dependent methyltransferase